MAGKQKNDAVTKADFGFPSIEEIELAYAPALEKLNGLREEHRRLERLASGAGLVQEKHHQELEREAAQFLETGELPDLANRELEGHRRRAADEHRKIVARAIPQQEQKIAALVQAASRKICEKLAPQHRELVRRRAVAVLEVLKLNQQEQDLFDELDRAGVHKSLPHSVYGLVGLFQDAQSGGAIYLRELVSQKLLDPQDPVIRTLELAHEGQSAR